MDINAAVDGGNILALNSLVDSMTDLANHEFQKISIVIPVYNEIQTIRQVLDRVMASPFDKEIILVDDCSTDGTRDLLRGLEGTPGVRVFFQDRNLPVCG